jgi:hypothetical protein
MAAVLSAATAEAATAGDMHAVRVLANAIAHLTDDP